VPTLVISPFARRGHVSHKTFDHTSILKMIEWRWNLHPLTPRDKHANNLATALDFTDRDTSAPVYDVPPFTSVGCSAAEETDGPEFAEWPALKQHLLATGWKPPR
jgi:phospholipase C